VQIGSVIFEPSIPQNEDIVKWALVLQWPVMSMCVSRLLFSWEVHQDGRPVKPMVMLRRNSLAPLASSSSMAERLRMSLMSRMIPVVVIGCGECVTFVLKFYESLQRHIFYR
jgi:hypothetical protein